MPSFGFSRVARIGRPRVDLFPLVQQNFAREELEALGEQMERMFDELQQSEPRAAIPSETDQAAPLE